MTARHAKNQQRQGINSLHWQLSQQNSRSFQHSGDIFVLFCNGQTNTFGCPISVKV